jgi:hypothetical protein
VEVMAVMNDPPTSRCGIPNYKDHGNPDNNLESPVEFLKRHSFSVIFGNSRFESRQGQGLTIRRVLVAFLGPSIKFRDITQINYINYPVIRLLNKPYIKDDNEGCDSFSLFAAKRRRSP